MTNKLTNLTHKDVAKNKIRKILCDLTQRQALDVYNELLTEFGFHNEDMESLYIRSTHTLRTKPHLLPFILSLPLKTLTQTRVLELCDEKFGKSESISRSSLYRMWFKLLLMKTRKDLNN